MLYWDLESCTAVGMKLHNFTNVERNLKLADTNPSKSGYKPLNAILSGQVEKGTLEFSEELITTWIEYYLIISY